MLTTSQHKTTKENQTSDFGRRPVESKSAFASWQNKFNASPFDFNQIPLQAKLKINTPGDRYEQEADRIADRVVNMNKVGASELNGNSQIQEKSLSHEISSISGLSTQRKCSQCDQEEEMLQQKASNTQPASITSSFNAQLNATKGKGHSMDQSTNQYMSSRFGVDFNHVNIHTNDKAAKMSESINAKAFTLGNDIYFNKWAYQPQSNEGKRLLAHELVHTVQQASELKDSGMIQLDCADDKRKCRSSLNWSDGGHWQGTGPEPDCNCDSSFTDAQAACGNRLNWSDGGHWIGSGPEPNCNLTRTGESQFTLTYLFPSNECVQQYNEGRNSISTHVSTGAGIITGTVAAVLGGNPAYGIVGGGVVNELIGAIPQVPIGVGYKWRRVMSVRYTSSAHPWGVSRIVFGVESSIFNENNELVHGYSTAREIRNTDVMRLGRLIVQQGSGHRTINCPRANVLSM